MKDKYFALFDLRSLQPFQRQADKLLFIYIYISLSLYIYTHIYRGALSLSLSLSLTHTHTHMSTSTHVASFQRFTRKWTKRYDDCVSDKRREDTASKLACLFRQFYLSQKLLKVPHSCSLRIGPPPPPKKIRTDRVLTDVTLQTTVFCNNTKKR